LRISDLLSLQWKQVYDLENRSVREHLLLVEAKTGKASNIYLNEKITVQLQKYYRFLASERSLKISGDAYLFCGKDADPISRVQAYRIIRKAAENSGLSGVISPHSLRKTFGYYAWKQGVPPVLLMEIYHHSSFDITKRYLGIEQDDRDEVFRKICL
jgi:site-specific recombinase XerD